MGLLDELKSLLEAAVPLANFTYFQLLIGIIVLVIGIMVARLSAKIVNGVMIRNNLPDLLAMKMANMFKYLLYVIVVFVFVGILGYDTGFIMLSLSAIIGLILGFGLKDTINNVFAGIWIAMLRPFDKDDYVELTGLSGSVDAVSTLATQMHTPDNVYVTIPNGTVWGAAIKNSTRMPTRRVDVPVGVTYEGGLSRAVSLAIGLMTDHPLVHQDPKPVVLVSDLGDSSVNLSLRSWCSNGDYWTVKGDLTRGVYELYKREGVEIPYPQLDVHLDG